ncbi:hypothetical protein AB0L44_02070 [Nonomuraea wenchangensis]|uniref:hypothetical protein n=1 Tax=Nonomuraea wenchangensis TaxID=568860 RepID=UPI0034169AFA
MALDPEGVAVVAAIATLVPSIGLILRRYFVPWIRRDRNLVVKLTIDGDTLELKTNRPEDAEALLRAFVARHSDSAESPRSAGTDS